MKTLHIKGVTTQNCLRKEEELLISLDKNPELPPTLLLWESPNYLVVLGRSNKTETEVLEEHCKALGIPIIKRSSGGGTVILGPGCLCYSLILPIGKTGPLSNIQSTNCHIMKSIASVINKALDPNDKENKLVTDCDRKNNNTKTQNSAQKHAERKSTQLCSIKGYTDLCLGEKKFSGNAQRRLKNALLFHGSILYDFELEKISETLAHPSKEPEYRNKRSHSDFLTNLPLSKDELLTAFSQLKL